MVNQTETNNIDISFFDFKKNKFYNFILKLEPNISRVLFLTSTVLFLLENTILKLPFLLINLTNPFLWILISIWILILIVYPIWIHILLVRTQLKIFIKSYEMIASLIIFIVSFFVQFLPDVQFCAYTVYGTYCSTYPGGFLFGLLFIFILMLFSYPMITKSFKKKELTSLIIDFNPILLKLNNQINIIKDEIFQNTTNLNRSAELFINSNEDSQRIELFNKVENYNVLIAQLNYFLRQLKFIKNNPQILDNRANYAYSQNQFESGIRLSIKSITKSDNKKKMVLLKRYHTLALNLTGKKNYHNAFNVFKFILKNTKSLNIIDFETLCTVLYNLGYFKAYNSVKQREFKSLFKTLEIKYKSVVYFFEKIKNMLIVLIIIVSTITLLNVLNYLFP